MDFPKLIFPFFFLAAFCSSADARRTQVAAVRSEAPPVRVPIVRAPAFWDSNIVPRYRYRPEDDRVDPCGGPVVPVIRVGPQEQTVPPLLASSLGLGRIHGRDWPCRARR